MDILDKYILITITLLSCCLSSVPGIAQDGLVVVSEIVPGKYSELSTKDQVDVMGGLAESAFGILEKVPEKGLRACQGDIDRIIAARKWLEDIRDVSAGVLAIVLQRGVDSCVLNELFRSDKVRAGASLSTPFKPGSFDRTLVMNILRSNNINEIEHINFALSLDTNIGNFCRKRGLKARDFIDGTIFNQYPRELSIGAINSRRVDRAGREQKIELTEDGTLMTDISFPAVIMFATAIDSKEKLSKVFLPILLGAIDDSRDVRILTSLFWKHGGFADPNQLGGARIINSDSLKKRLEKEIVNDKMGRIVRRKGQNSLRVLDAIGKMSKRVESYDDVDGYLTGQALYFRLFVRSADIFPLEYREPMLYAGIGLWLGLADN